MLHPVTRVSWMILDSWWAYLGIRPLEPSKTNTWIKRAVLRLHGYSEGGDVLVIEFVDGLRMLAWSTSSLSRNGRGSVLDGDW